MGQNQKNTQEPDMNQLRKVRREKLAELQQNGRDPFQITKFNQTHHSLEVKDLYEAHEAEILKDHQQPNVEGMDEEQAKEALKNDYEERRSILDVAERSFSHNSLEHHTSCDCYVDRACIHDASSLFVIILESLFCLLFIHTFYVRLLVIF